MNNQPPQSNNQSLITIIYLLVIVGVPVGVIQTFGERLAERPWLSAAILIMWFVISGIGSLFTPVFQEQKKRINNAINVRLDRVKPGYQRRYKKHLVDLHRDFDVKGLTTQGAHNLELQRVFVELSITAQPAHTASKDPIRKAEENPQGQSPIWYYLREEKWKHLAILGAPGSGKTTLLKNVALILASGWRQRRKVGLSNKLPILLFLRDHADPIHKNGNFSIVDAIENDLERYTDVKPPSGWFAARLSAGQCLVLLDGLDEVADLEIRKKVSTWVEAQIVKYSKNSFLVSSRPHGFQGAPITRVTVLEVQPFTQSQVGRFVHNWYLANETMASRKEDRGVQIKARNGAEDLLSRLRNTPTLADLAVNPLLLTMIATVHRFRSSLPGRRVELYAEVCEVFLGKRQQTKDIAQDLNPAQKQRVLQPLALHLMQNNRREIKFDEVKRIIATPLSLVTKEKGEAAVTNFLKTIESGSGLLLEREVGEYSFAHQSFQEYLAAVHIREEKKQSILLNQLDNTWWHEVIRLYAAQTDASPIIGACLGLNPPPIQALVLAVECIEEAREVKPELREQLEKLLSEGVEDEERWGLVAEILLTRRLKSMIRVDEDTYIDPTYVTHAEYQLFLDQERTEGKYYQPDHWTELTFSKGLGTSPVVGIRPTDAQAFCQWLNLRSGLKDWHFRLPKPGETERHGLSAIKDTGTSDGWWVITEKDFEFEGRKLLSSHERFLINFDVASNTAHELARTLDGNPARGREVDRNRELARTLDRVRNRELDFDLELARGRARDLDLTLVRDLARARAGEVDRGRDLDLNLDLVLEIARYRELDLVRDLDLKGALVIEIALTIAHARQFYLAGDLDRAGDFDLDRANTSSIKRAQARYLALERDLGRIHTNILSYFFNLARDFTIMKTASERSFLRWYVRGLVASYATAFQIVLNEHKSKAGFLNRLSMTDKSLEKLRDSYLKLFVDFTNLEARIYGGLSAFEALRIIRERVKDTRGTNSGN